MVHINHNTASILLLLMLSACVSPKDEIPTRIAVSLTQTPMPTSYVAKIGDGGLISGQPCASPCFFGIHIGETRFDQVIPILKTNGIYPCRQVSERNIFCTTSNTANVVVAMNESTFLVDGISYNPSVSILVGDVIIKYGEPNSVYLELDDTGTPEFPKLLMSLSWDSMKIGGDLTEISARDQIYIVESTSEIQWVSLGEGGYFAQAQPWRGYGPYKP
jgi:hypothetical protein